MVFKDIKQNFPIYLLDKNSVEIIKGKVTGATFPHLDTTAGHNNMPNNGTYNPMSAPFNQAANQRMVIDLTIEANGRTATYTVSENASVNYAGNLVIATEQSALTPEIEAIKNAAEQELSQERMEQLKNQLERSTALLAEIDPAYKQQQEQENRLNKMESSIEDMKSMIANFIKEFKS